jgi:hypothetical protein
VSTIRIPPTPTPSPAPPSKLQNILSIINLALQGLSTIPVLSLPIALEQTFQKILTNALAAYQQETGQPIDLSKIPQETPVP